MNQMTCVTKRNMCRWIELTAKGINMKQCIFHRFSVQMQRVFTKTRKFNILYFGSPCHFIAFVQTVFRHFDVFILLINFHVLSLFSVFSLCIWHNNSEPKLCCLFQTNWQTKKCTEPFDHGVFFALAFSLTDSQHLSLSSFTLSVSYTVHSFRLSSSSSVARCIHLYCHTMFTLSNALFLFLLHPLVVLSAQFLFTIFSLLIYFSFLGQHFIFLFQIFMSAPSSQFSILSLYTVIDVPMLCLQPISMSKLYVVPYFDSYSYNFNDHRPYRKGTHIRWLSYRIIYWLCGL